MKIKTLKDVEKDPRVECLIRNYDGKGRHLIELKEGFTCWDAGSIIGNARLLIDDFNNYVKKQDDEINY